MKRSKFAPFSLDANLKLKVWLTKVRNLVNSTIGRQPLTYFIVKVGQEQHTTPPRQVGTEGIVNEWISISTVGYEPFMYIECWWMAEDTFSKDDLIGLIMVPLSGISKGGRSGWFSFGNPLSRDVSFPGKKGELWIELTVEQETKSWKAMENDFYALTSHSNYSLTHGQLQTHFTIPGIAETIELVIDDITLVSNGHLSSRRLYLTNFRLIFIDLEVKPINFETETSFSKLSRKLDKPVYVMINLLSSIQRETNQGRSSFSFVCRDFRFLKALFPKETPELLIQNFENRIRFQTLNSISIPPAFEIFGRLNGKSVGSESSYPSEQVHQTRSKKKGSKFSIITPYTTWFTLPIQPSSHPNEDHDVSSGPNVHSYSQNLSLNPPKLKIPKSYSFPTAFSPSSNENEKDNQINSSPLSNYEAYTPSLDNQGNRKEAISLQKIKPQEIEIETGSESENESKNGNENENGIKSQHKSEKELKDNEQNDTQIIEGSKIEQHDKDQLIHNLSETSQSLEIKRKFNIFVLYLYLVIYYSKKTQRHSSHSNISNARAKLKNIQPRMSTAIDQFDMEKEMRRQGISNLWRLSLVNENYELCSSYPSQIFVPINVSDEDLMEAKLFRTNGRIPTISWYNKKKGNVIARSSQPNVGIVGNSCSHDQKLLECLRLSTPNHSELVIFDARSKLAARGNKFKGFGTEDTTLDYKNCRLYFLGLGNIHAIKLAEETFTQGVLDGGFSGQESTWLSTVQESQWLWLISRLISSALKIAYHIEELGVSVLIHCSDGWDRTAQLSALAQLLLDPFYRTFEGIQILIEKEWLAFGHKFEDRAGDPSNSQTKMEQSPIFFQFIDCVWQLTQQFPTAFEFNNEYLITLADHHLSGWFGTFLYNNEKERVQERISQKTFSIWSFLSHNHHSFSNPSYIPEKNVLIPVGSIKTMRFWSSYYLRYDKIFHPKFSLKTNEDETDLNGEQSSSERGGQRIVLWLPDDAASHCHGCSAPFNFLFRRKHHCRNCGNIFCSSCVESRAYLRFLGYETPQKVCGHCHAILHQPQNLSLTQTINTSATNLRIESSLSISTPNHLPSSPVFNSITSPKRSRGNTLDSEAEEIEVLSNPDLSKSPKREFLLRRYSMFGNQL